MGRKACLVIMGALLGPAVCEAELRDAMRAVYKVGAARADGARAMGSAVLIAPGKLVTSCHTTRDAARVSILHREGELAAQTGVGDARHDLCLLSVPELRGPVAQRLRSSDLQIGQPVVAVGFADGFARSIEQGQITALYRMDGGNVVRTSAVFPRGASGGGLFTDTGLLVGILTFRGTAGEDLNYAVPTEWVDLLLEQEAMAKARPSHYASFWEDDATRQPLFIQAAWLESAQEWTRLEALALDWTLIAHDDAEAWLALGRAKLALDATKDAVLALRTAVTLSKRHVKAWFWLAIAYHRIGFPGEFVYASYVVEDLDLQQAAELSRWTTFRTTSP
jgi:hypothetical protein